MHFQMSIFLEKHKLNSIQYPEPSQPGLAPGVNGAPRAHPTPSIMKKKILKTSFGAPVVKLPGALVLRYHLNPLPPSDGPDSILLKKRDDSLFCVFPPASYGGREQWH